MCLKVEGSGALWASIKMANGVGAILAFAVGVIAIFVNFSLHKIDEGKRQVTFSVETAGCMLMIEEKLWCNARHLHVKEPVHHDSTPDVDPALSLKIRKSSNALQKCMQACSNLLQQFIHARSLAKRNKIYSSTIFNKYLPNPSSASQKYEF